MGVVNPSEEKGILDTIIEMLGYDATVMGSDHFYNQVMIHINSVFSILRQLGLGDDKGYKITSADNKWSEVEALVPDGNIEDIKTYIYLKVGLYFDPPTSSILLSAIREEILELEGRIKMEVEIHEL